MLSTIEPQIGKQKYHSHILSTIGHTPLIKLSRLTSNLDFSVFGKMESMNPGGSIKDRTAFNMLTEALNSRIIKAGDTIIESSSGNMALGLAQACKFHGINLIIVVDPKVNAHSLKILKAFGAKVVKVTEPKTEGGFLESRIQKVQQLLAEHPNSHCLNQYKNAANPQTHYQTMREIAQQLDQKIDYIFISTSTCGTLMGCAQYIYENRLSTKIIAVDAVGSVTFGQKEDKRLIPGHGSGKPSNFLNLDLIDDVIHITDEECIHGCWTLLENESILCGGSSGAVITAINKYAGKIPANSNSVIILCDRGERYLDTIYNKPWVSKHFPGFEYPHVLNKD